MAVSGDNGVADELASRVLAGDRRALAQAITLVESGLSEHLPRAERLLGRLAARACDSLRIGITGPPGVGKSTLVEAFGLHLVAAGKRVAVLAVDPTSVPSGGSVLGDKTRMSRLAGEAAAFIRPSPSRLHLGGCAPATPEAVLVCEAAGHDVVIIETVGVGQSECAVADLADVFVLLLPAGGGDDLQMMKRGVLEVADVIAVTKADGDEAARAERMRGACESALRQSRRPGKRPGRVLLTSAREGRGIDELWAEVGAHHEEERASGRWSERRMRQRDALFMSRLETELRTRFLRRPDVRAVLAQMRAAVACGEVTPHEAVRTVLALA